MCNYLCQLSIGGQEPATLPTVLLILQKQRGTRAQGERQRVQTPADQHRARQRPRMLLDASKCAPCCPGVPATRQATRRLHGFAAPARIASAIALAPAITFIRRPNNQSPTVRTESQCYCTGSQKWKTFFVAHPIWALNEATSWMPPRCPRHGV